MISVLCLDGSHTYPCIVYTCRFDVTRKAIISFKNFLPRNCEFVWEKAAYKNQQGINKSSGIISGFLKINEIISSGKIIHNSNAITNIPLNVTESLSHNHNNIIRYLLLFTKPVNINHSITDSSRCAMTCTDPTHNSWLCECFELHIILKKNSTPYFYVYCMI